MTSLLQVCIFFGCFSVAAGTCPEMFERPDWETPPVLDEFTSIEWDLEPGCTTELCQEYSWRAWDQRRKCWTYSWPMGYCLYNYPWSTVCGKVSDGFQPLARWQRSVEEERAIDYGNVTLVRDADKPGARQADPAKLWIKIFNCWCSGQQRSMSPNFRNESEICWTLAA